MSSSALNQGVLSAKISNIQNAADSSGVYSAGVWSFKNSTALTSVTITDAGNVGIGTSSPNSQAGFTILHVGSATTSGLLDLTRNGAQQFRLFCSGADAAIRNDATSGNITFTTKDSGGTSAERMRIDASGQLTLPAGLTGSNLHTINGSSTTATAAVNFIKPTGADSASNFYLNFTTNTNQQGYIWNDAAGNIALATVSDESLKENIRPLDSGITKIKQLNPVVYDWKSGCAKDSIGFIAQEFEQVFPNAVGEMEGIKAIGFGPEFYAVLVKAIQELSAKVDAQAAEIEALKAK